MSNPIDLRWIARCQLELIGITGNFYIYYDHVSEWTTYKLQIQDAKDRFIYELHGGDAVVWKKILEQHAKATERWYFPDGFAAKSHAGKI